MNIPWFTIGFWYNEHHKHLISQPSIYSTTTKTQKECRFISYGKCWICLFWKVRDFQKTQQSSMSLKQISCWFVYRKKKSPFSQKTGLLFFKGSQLSFVSFPPLLRRRLSATPRHAVSPRGKLRGHKTSKHTEVASSARSTCDLSQRLGKRVETNGHVNRFLRGRGVLFKGRE